MIKFVHNISILLHYFYCPNDSLGIQHFILIILNYTYCLIEPITTFILSSVNLKEIEDLCYCMNGAIHIFFGF